MALTDLKSPLSTPVFTALKNFVTNLLTSAVKRVDYTNVTTADPGATEAEVHAMSGIVEFSVLTIDPGENVQFTIYNNFVNQGEVWMADIYSETSATPIKVSCVTEQGTLLIRIGNYNTSQVLVDFSIWFNAG